MAHWNFWEWMAYALVWVSALISAADMGLKMAPELRERMLPVLSSAWWAFTPLVAIVLATLIFLSEAAGVPLPQIPKLVLPGLALAAATGFAIAVVRSLRGR